MKELGAKYVKKLADSVVPIWARVGGQFKRKQLTVEEIETLDKPEGVVVVEVSGTLYAAMLRIAQKKAQKKGFDPLASRKGPN